MKYLGIDYGKSKIGLAISEGSLVSPFKIIQVNSLTDALNKIIHVIKVENVDRIIIGLADSGEAKKITEKFIQELKTQKIKVDVIDETLSSQSAIDQMVNLGVSKKSRGKEDAFSAANILQNYLDQIN